MMRKTNSNCTTALQRKKKRGHTVSCLLALFVIFTIVCGLRLQIHLGVADAQAEEPANASHKFSELGGDTCLTCHNDDRMQQLFRTPHGQQVDPNAPFAYLQCESCHGPAAEHTARDITSKTHAPIINFGDNARSTIDEQNAVCTGCHNKDVGMQWAGSEHERNDVSCVSCHNIHETQDPVLSPAEEAKVCFTCHDQQRADSQKPSAHPVRSGVMSCSDCHNPHHSATDALLKRHDLNEMCWSCHTELRGPYLFEHAPVSEDCSLCHFSHGSIHPNLLVKRPPLLCQSCHSSRGHPSRAVTEDNLASGTNPSTFGVGASCMNCHSQVHGTNHPSGMTLMR
jgi:DmsE family decaheme c-type cytochrome